jgi:hypothetical protein
MGSGADPDDDENPDVWQLFRHYDKLYFRGVLVDAGFSVEWSQPRMKTIRYARAPHRFHPAAAHAILALARCFLDFGGYPGVVGIPKQEMACSQVLSKISLNKTILPGIMELRILRNLRKGVPSF